MKNNLLKSLLAASGSLVMTVFLINPGYSQDASEDDRQARFEERREAMRERRAELLENNPDIAAQREERRQRREEFLENNPEAQARMEERRERIRNGDGRGPRPGFRRGPGGPRGPGSSDSEG